MSQSRSASKDACCSTLRSLEYTLAKLEEDRCARRYARVAGYALFGSGDSGKQRLRDFPWQFRDEDDHFYLERHGVEELVSKMLAGVMQQRPESPSIHMLQFLAERLPASDLASAGLYRESVAEEVACTSENGAVHPENILTCGMHGETHEVNGAPTSPVQEATYSVPLTDAAREDGSIAITTWNVAAVNNNPFEYWLTLEDDGYLQLMAHIESFLENPSDHDVMVHQIFTQEMFDELCGIMAAEGWDDLDVVREMWNTDYCVRQIISGFLKDTVIGKKRLVSMPDRYTNTIHQACQNPASKYCPPPVFRPTVINNFEGDLSELPWWWEKWKRFMFCTPVSVRTKQGVEFRRPCEMLERIPHAKYPAISEAEEAISIPLQVLCQGIFDAILVHLMNVASPDGSWQELRSRLCQQLYWLKHRRTAEILAKNYSGVEVICLQEVAGIFIDNVKQHGFPLEETHHIILPERLDGKRDQNSLILLRKDKFPIKDVVEVTSAIVERFHLKIPLNAGDLLAVRCNDAAGSTYLIVSFHGDTDGKLTVPVFAAINLAVKDLWPSAFVLLGMDANVYCNPDAGQQSLDGFMEDVVSCGFTSCWGDEPDLACCMTTCKARTYVQPQLNKAVRSVDRVSMGDRNPKDLIIFQKDQYQLVQPPSKDNTGKVKYVENMMFPTPDFPSDHGILTAVLKRRVLLRTAGTPSGDVYAIPLSLMPRGGDSIAIATWNVAAVNNNPFEYWLTVRDPMYLELMGELETLVDSPGVHDMSVDQIFTHEMFSELSYLMNLEGWANVDTVESLWHSDYRSRPIISGFMKSQEIGEKRLVSMPDRCTNTIHQVAPHPSVRYKPPPLFRPSVINNFEGDLSSITAWWDQWKRFMFETPATVRTSTGTMTQRPCEMLDSITRAKFPAVTDVEESVSVPLQLLCQAIFDASLVYLMNLVSPDGAWQHLKARLCERLYRLKHQRTAEILTHNYAAVEVICLQETAAVFQNVVHQHNLPLGASHYFIQPEGLDGTRDQNSLILLRKDRFPIEHVTEVTDVVLECLEWSIPLKKGDLLAIKCMDVFHNEFLIVSFHADTEGSFSVPVMKAIHTAVQRFWSSVPFVLLGLAANIALLPGGGKQTLDGFMNEAVSLGLTTCWGDAPNSDVCKTTCSARTFLQPQQNKAVQRWHRVGDGDQNPKDLIVFFKDQFDALQPPTKDNTGKLKYVENAMFPTLDFPSDHGILATALKMKLYS